ncbi:MAG: hypothetical protein DCF22_24280 [Leptolyngbya sp.]|nr:MAG: hypothetical protein DCF22_24280 [Leptolyngbya sp.]
MDLKSRSNHCLIRLIKNAARSELTVTQQASNGRGVRSQEPGVRINSELKTLPDTRHPTPDTPIIEATGWQITPTGEVLLVANTPDPAVQNRLNQVISCQGR